MGFMHFGPDKDLIGWGRVVGGQSRAMFSIRSSLLEPKWWSSKEDAEKEDAENVTQKKNH
jgi:hypothetical protein